MSLKYEKSESAISPPLIDATSSKKVVYLRKDVSEKQHTDETTGQTYAYYEYLEAKVSKEEYQAHLQRQQRADIDYIALMTGVDLEETEEVNEQNV